jgi:tRNA A37 threonylcarbamoyladenosine modification protein TsaB
VAVQAHSNAGLIVPVLDARRCQLYFGLYRRAAGAAPGESRLVLDGEEYVMTPAEFFEALRERAAGAEFAIVTPQPELFSGVALQNEIANLKAVVEPASAVLAPFIGQLGFRQAQRGVLADPLTLDANYVRRTDAELHWKES